MPRHSRLACIPGGLDSIRSAVPLVQVWISFLGYHLVSFCSRDTLWGALVLVRRDFYGQQDMYLKRVHSLVHGSLTETSSFFFIVYETINQPNSL